ncbi:hypothetical protein [Phenylobacterium montanum]|uniref:Uncharacterized protein n=1 Tax=Phenylobacterium montanum TaxID=2823693 RepID=A0A975G216_9CAUL|nr:hypothetical protein [Caulobacter sp. S6]QUD89683.1 hypothetical protein KCG34_07370 [Caulobacter sp. S6]
MAASPRSRSSVILALLLFAGGLVMAFLGSMAAGYYVPAACLALLAALIWLGRASKLVGLVALINVVSGMVLLLDLWLGGGLGDLKLDISGVALLVNLATGGPILSLVAALLLTRTSLVRA